MTKITIKVPASTGNLGPGFDCLGLALALYNTTTVELADDIRLTVSGEGMDKIPTDKNNLVWQSAEKVFEVLGKRPSGFHLHQHNNIPVGSGMGSSATAVIAGLLAANALIDGELSQEQIFLLANQIEPSPDNAAPSIYGGLTLVTSIDKSSYHVEPIAIVPQEVVIVLPNFHFPTITARAALPNDVPMKDAIFNVSHTALVIQALIGGNYAKLGFAMQDRLHQPYRLKRIPGAEQAIRAAQNAGAKAVALSGAGPSLIAFSPNNHEAIAQAMIQAFQQAGLASRYWVLPFDTQGATVNVNTS